MNKRLSEQMESMVKGYQKHKKLMNILAIAVAVVIAATGIVMSLPASTATVELICGQEEHAHTEDCYDEEGTLVCGLEEHAHTADCYEQAGTLTSETSDKMTAAVSYDAGVIHYNTTLSAALLADDNAQTSVTKIEEELADKDLTADTTKVYDLTLIKNEQEVEPDGKVSVVLDFENPVTAQNEENADQITWKLYHILDDNTLIDLTEEKNTVIETDANNAVTKVSFETESFSKYALSAAVKSAVEEEPEAPSEDAEETIAEAGENEINSSEENCLPEDTSAEATENQKSSEEISDTSKSEETAEEDVPDTASDIKENNTSEENIENTSENAAAQEEYPAQDFSGWANFVTVSVSADKGALPDGTTMKVKTVRDNDILKAAANAADKDVKVKTKAVDISFYNKDGDEIEPLKPIRVTMKANAIKKTGDVTVVHVNDKNKAEVIAQTSNQMLEKDEKADANEVVFDADAFSAYVLVYTVDFSYGSEEYSIPGGSFIMLSDVLNELRIQKNNNGDILLIKDVESVKFSDENLIEIEQEDYDWKLTSKQAFKSEETLTLSLTDGDTVQITVTDAQEITNLGELISEMSISGATLGDDGKYHVAAGDTFTINISFAETTGVQFDMNNDLTYQLPSGFSPKAVSNATGTISTAKGNVTFTYSITEDGKVTVHWPEDKSSDTWQALTSSQYAKLVLHLEGSFDSSASEVKFTAEDSGTVVVNNDSDLETTKTGYYDPATNKIYYTVTVKSTGHNKNIKVVDKISGNALTYDQSSFSASKQDSVTHEADGFTYTLNDMNDGETVTIRYAADVDLSKISKDEINNVLGTEGETKNTVKGTSDNHPDEPEHSVTGKDLTNKISYSNIVKSHTGQSTDDDGNKIISWQILVNENANVSMGGKTVTDTITTPNTLEYTGDYITVLVRNKEGAVIRIDQVKLSEILAADKTSWNYKIPDSDNGKNYSYLFTYDTKVKVSDSDQSVEVKNKAKDEYGESESGTWVNPGTGDTDDSTPQVTKKATNIDVANQEITWKINVDVPKEGYSEKLEVWDTYPSRWIAGDGTSDGKTVRDTYKENSIEVEGLYSNEGYELDTSNADKLGIKFFHYVNGEKKYGLSSGDEDRQVKISLKTELNEEYIKAAETNDEAKWHYNEVNVQADNYNINAGDRAYVNPEALTVSKSHYQMGSINIDGVETPTVTYEIKITGITEDSFDENGKLILTDTYDSTYFEWLKTHPWGGQSEARNGYVYGGSIWNAYGAPALVEGQNYPGKKVVSENTLGTLTITLDKDSIPKDDDSYYPVYVIPYHLICTDVDGLKKAASQSYGGIYTLENTVHTDGVADVTDEVDYSTDILTKEQIAGPTFNKETGIYEVQYKLVANPNAEKLGTENFLTLKDTLHNLNVQTGSIKVTPSGGVSWDYDTNNMVEGTNGILTFTIPNETRVEITYTANVVGTGTVNYSNTAELYGQSKEEKGTKNGDSSMEGTSSLYFMNIHKYEEGDLTVSLEGVKFDLYVLNDGYLDDSSSKNNKPSESDSRWTRVNDEDKPFETDESGNVAINAETLAIHDPTHNNLLNIHDGLYRRQWYKLVETENPVINGVEYEGQGTTYLFWIDDTADANVSKGIIANGDTVLISNKPKDDTKIGLQIKKTWEVEDTDDIPDSISFDLYQKENQYADNSTAKKIRTIELKKSDFTDSNGNVKTVWNDVFQDLPSGYAYFIKEQSIDGYIVTYDENNSYGYTKTSTIGVTNKKQDITIEKKWLDENGKELPDGPSKFDSIVVNILKDGEEYKSVTLKKEEGWKVTLKDLEFPGTYTVSEPNVKGFVLDNLKYTVTDPDGKTENSSSGLSSEGTVTITNKKKTIKVQKIWQNQYGNDLSENDPGDDLIQSIKITVYEDGEVYGRYELERSNNWELELDDLDWKGKFTVEEDPVNGYTLNNIEYYTSAGDYISDQNLSDSGTIKVKNKKVPITPDTSKASVTVQKKWLDSNSEEIGESSIKNAEATVQLVRYRKVKSGATIHFITGWANPRSINTEFANSINVKNNERIELTYQYTGWAPNAELYYPDGNGLQQLNLSSDKNETAKTITYTFDSGTYSDIYLWVGQSEQFASVIPQYDNNILETSDSDSEIDSTYNGEIKVLNYSYSWTAVFNDLPKSETINGITYEYTYGIEEKSCTSGYAFDHFVVDGTVSTESSKVSDAGSEIILFNKKEESGFELPVTGGIGTTKLILSGLALMMIAMLLMIRKRIVLKGGK